MTTRKIIALAKKHLHGLAGHEFDVLEVAKPVSPGAAVNLAKIISKLSPLVGNLIEFNTCEYLNDQADYVGLGTWIRQDPGFPDTIFSGEITPTPGFEIKAWFPLATEITARFKDSQNHFQHDQTYVAMLAWLPEFLIYGKPQIISMVAISGKTVAKARDDHYHNPPGYLVLEPENTTSRTVNLQQTNTNGYKFQGTADQLAKAQRIVKKWGAHGRNYQPTPEYQVLLRTLLAQFPYRLDTNFAKMDRIAHPEIEAFKAKVYDHQFHGKSIGAWNQLLSSRNEEAIKLALAERFQIEEDEKPVVL